MNSNDQIDQLMMIMEAAFDPAWGEAWNRAQVLGALATPNTHLMMIDAEGAPVTHLGSTAAGFVMTRTAADEEELLLIAVMPEYRKRGIGRKLIEKMICQARDRGALNIFLEMRSNNTAESLYRSIGFKPIGIRKGYYKRPGGGRIDAITFSLSI